MHSYDVVVVGAGVIGLACGWRLSQRGLKTAVVERGFANEGASRVATGMIAPVSEAYFGEEALLRLGLASTTQYPQFIAELQEVSTTDPLFAKPGTLALAGNADEAAELERMFAFRRRLDLPAWHLRPSAVRQFEPALAPRLRAALSIPDEHIVDPQCLLQALTEAFRSTGGTLVTNTEVDRILTTGNRVTGIYTSDQQTVETVHVVLAAGCWSSQITGIPDHSFVPLRPIKGQLLVLKDARGAGLIKHVLRMPESYLAPRGDGRYILGATTEEQGFDRRVTVGAVFQLLRDAEYYLPDLVELEIVRIVTGLRPVTPDSRTVIGTAKLEGLIWASGHYRSGILLAPITAEAVSKVVAGEQLSPLIQQFTPSRFSNQEVHL